MDNEPAKVLEQAALIKITSRWPEQPYQWIANDLRRALYDADANYLVALGLLCYTEYMGREVMSRKNSQIRPERIDNKKAFNLFLGEYLGHGYKELINKYDNKIYDWFRNGAAHGYRLKGQDTGVFHYVAESAKPFLEKIGVRADIGIVVVEKDGKYDNFLIARTYLKDFINGIDKYLLESGQL